MATVFVSQFVDKQFYTFVVDTDSEDLIDFALMAEMGFFALTGNRYQMILPPNLDMDTVKQAHLAETPTDLARKVRIEDRDSTVDSMYLRIIVHDNEHMGQLVAYARMTGVVPPWSK